MSAALTGTSAEFISTGSGDRSNKATFTPNAGEDLILCFFIKGYNESISTVSGMGVTWVKAVASTQQSDRPRCEIWYGLNSSGSGGTITFTATGFNEIEVEVRSATGIDATTPISGTPTSQYGRSNTASAGAMTPGNGDDVLIFSAACSNSNPAINSGPSSPFTALRTDANGRNGYYSVASASGSYNPTYANGNNYTRWGCCLVAFKSEGAAAPEGRSRIVNVNRAVHRAANW